MQAILHSLLEHCVGSSSFEIALRYTLRQVANDAKDLLVVIPESRLGVSIRARETGYIAVMALIGGIQRWRRLNVGVGDSRSAGEHCAGILLQHKC